VIAGTDSPAHGADRRWGTGMNRRTAVAALPLATVFIGALAMHAQPTSAASGAANATAHDTKARHRT
jgi:hypothetical protein